MNSLLAIKKNILPNSLSTYLLKNIYGTTHWSYCRKSS